MITLSVRSSLGTGGFEVDEMVTLNGLVHWGTHGMHSLPTRMRWLQEKMPLLKMHSFFALLQGKQAMI